MMKSIETDYISLSEAEKLTGKSRPTLTRLCNRVEDTHARRDTSGAWLIERDFVMRYYQVGRNADDEQVKSSVKGEMQWIMQRVEQLEKRLQEVIFSNQTLINENRQLQDENRRLLQTGEDRPDQLDVLRPWIVLLLIVAILIIGIVFTVDLIRTW